MARFDLMLRQLIGCLPLPWESQSKNAMPDEALPNPTPPTTLAEVVKILRDIREAMESARAEALDAEAAAQLAGVSRSQWFALDARGLVPASITVGEHQRRWLRRELGAWLAAGAPSRRQWELRSAGNRRAG
jgi:predicted DNA-binding transcriptional regulator AlpA